MNIRSRPMARLVVLDPLDRILVFETRLAYTHVWMTPGGGVKLATLLPAVIAGDVPVEPLNALVEASAVLYSVA